MSKKLSLGDVLGGIGPIVEANPDFIYPSQENADDERCLCIEMVDDPGDLDREIDEEYYDYSECPWHLDDDNTCRYVQPGGVGACVVGKYFVDELGFHDLHQWERRSPAVILEAHGYQVDKQAWNFLNTIQQQQDQGWSWTEAYDQAVAEVSHVS